MKILYFTANPELVVMPSEPGFSDKGKLDIAKYTKLDLWPELREVSSTFFESRMAGDVQLEVVPEARAEDVVRYVEKFKPDIVHFSGHGEEKRLIVNAENLRSGETASAEWLKEALTDKGVQILVLNCCWSASFVETLKGTVGFVVGADEPLRVDLARSFAGKFYRALRDGKSVGEAYAEGSAVSEQYMSAPEQGGLLDKPFLKLSEPSEMTKSLVAHRRDLQNLEQGLTIERLWDVYKVVGGFGIAVIAYFVFSAGLPGWMVWLIQVIWSDADLTAVWGDTDLAKKWAEQEWLRYEPFAIYLVLVSKPLARVISSFSGKAGLGLAIEAVDFALLSEVWAKKHNVVQRVERVMTWLKERDRNE